MLPSVAGEHSIMPVADMRSFPKLKTEQAIALIRSRGYIRTLSGSVNPNPTFAGSCL